MKDSVEVNIEPVKADAELMSAWLGGMEDISMSPKLLFDLQTLLRHYADFLVPNKEIRVDYMAEGTPCASVDKNQIFIPLDMLKEGRVAETIAAVIHELHHIKYSDNERDICKDIMGYFNRILDTVEVEHYGKKLSIKQALDSHGAFNSGGIIDRKLTHSYKDFIYQYFGDLFLLLNAIEDVRIDEMQPKNLMKYRFKQEKNSFAKFEELHAEGKLDKDTLFGFIIDALFHLKGMGHSDLIAKSAITKDRILNVETPSQFYPPTFSTFAEVLQTHAGSLWKKFEEQESMNDSAISDFLIDETLSQEGNDSQVEGDEELGLEPKKGSDCPDLDEDFNKEVRDTFGEDDIRDLLNAMNGDRGEESDLPTYVMNPQLWAEIQAFKALNHIPCRESVQQVPQGINYDTLILDCYA